MPGGLSIPQSGEVAGMDCHPYYTDRMAATRFGPMPYARVLASNRLLDTVPERIEFGYHSPGLATIQQEEPHRPSSRLTRADPIAAAEDSSSGPPLPPLLSWSWSVVPG